MGKSKKRWILGILGCLLVIACLVVVGGYLWFQRELAPMPRAKSFLVRYRKESAFDRIAADLQSRGVVRNATAFHWYARWNHQLLPVAEGTYRFAPGMTVDQVIRSLRKQIQQMVRIPETNFSYRTANLLQKRDVLDAKDYKRLIRDPTAFEGEVSFPLPKSSLEGYLYPDTYDLPPLMGAHDTIERQLLAFQHKVYPLLEGIHDRNKVLTIASMVEMEAAKDKDRPLIAGVIVNRLKLNMPLQIDATILYALQKWRRLTFADYKDVQSAYNTYLHPGLPPGPICSPSLKSVEAALHPAQNDYLYYVALPNGYSLFAHTYEQHRANIAKRKAALVALAGSRRA